MNVRKFITAKEEQNNNGPEMDMFSLSREAAQYSSMDRKTSSVQESAARKQSTFDRRPSGDRRQSYAPNVFNAFHDVPAVSLLLVN